MSPLTFLEWYAQLDAALVLRGRAKASHDEARDVYNNSAADAAEAARLIEFMRKEDALCG